MRTRFAFLTLALATPLVAQPAQKVIPPETVYWLSAATQSGFGTTMGADPSAMMRMAMGGSGAAVKLLELDLGSKRSAAGAPAAFHAIPPGMQMGASLPLRSPVAEPVRRGEPTEPPEDFEPPRGRLLLFWGCGEAARPGQPVVIDFAKMAAGQIPPNLFAGERVRIARPPSASSWPRYGHWPHNDPTSLRGIPATASLLGSHKVTGNYTPDISFTLSQDWMAPLLLSQTKRPSGAIALSWNAVPGATGHFAQLMGGSEKDEGTVVFWSSSETQTFLSALSDYLAPAEAQRQVASRQLLPPSQTSCAIPKEAVAAVDGGILSLVAHGPEVNVIHPPRPSDPKIPWKQEWAVKARFVSRTGSILGMDMPAPSAAAASASGKPKCRPTAGEEAAASVGGAIAGSLGRGLGRAISRKKPAEDCEP
jgi:hypothetical protein